jgi:serine/threonine protein kinase
MIIGQQYKILAELGAGGMGIVYQGVDVMLEREVAIKRLRNEFSSSTDVGERFRKEAKIQARLRHDNLALLYSFLKDGDSFYIVMEFVNGTPLTKMLPMPWKEALPVFAQVLEGLEYAHSLGVLHRDIKPDNIMVDPQGVVKLMDFGIAHVLGSARQTREKTIVGTLEYVSPEQISGKELTQRSDIYSLGILLFELISGRLPFQAENEFELLRHHLETPPPKLSSVVECPPFLDQAVERATAKAPANRFQSCHEMADFLRKSAPEVFASPLASVRRSGRDDEAARCASRIEALLGGDEVDLAAAVFERSKIDYPDQPRLAGFETRIREARALREGASKQQERVKELHDIFQKLGALETSGNLKAAREAARDALERYPRVPALRIALASLTAGVSD